MVVDSSAMAAVLFGEEGSGEAGARDLAGLMAEAGIEVVAFDSGQAEIALAAWRRYGKGRHSANLSLVDCAAYALDALVHEGFLFVGEDFPQTDIARALQSHTSSDNL